MFVALLVFKVGKSRQLLVERPEEAAALKRTRLQIEEVKGPGWS